MDFASVIYEAGDGGVALIRLNRPEKLNSFDRQLRADLLAAIELANGDEAVRAVVLTGEGRGFSSGANLKAGLEGSADTLTMLREEYLPIFNGVREAPKLYIAAINGACAGIGASLAMACDLGVMADDAYIYQAFAAIGVVPDGAATLMLTTALGSKKALELIVEAGSLNAEQSLQAGLVNRVVPAANLVEEARAWAAKLALGAPLAQQAAKQAVRAAQTASFEQAFDLEAQLQNSLMVSEDAVAAVTAFLTKSKEQVVFKGR